jgi:uncharacterized membrane protein YgdD (TMEM256/DUF423 family)
MWNFRTARALAVLAGLLGAAGIAAAALAAHGGYDDNLRTASQFALIHAALVAALCLSHAPGRSTVVASAVIMLGAALFCGDLTLRALAGHGLFPTAAPSGGTIMIGGWLLLSISALTSKYEG